RLPRRWREWLADALILYCAIFFSLIWDTAVAGMHVAATDPLWARAILLVVALPAFFMFYAPVRLLFLVEDGHLRATWLRMALAGLPLVRHLLID
ncbi:MAG TPA: hypothetical protein VFF06_23905, partial [Polyangia bacterium]|nr:hypothetical protein [Polyangia bacterium]